MKMKLKLFFFTLYIVVANSLFSQIRLKTNSGHSEAITSIAFSPSGQFMVTGSYDNTIKIWDYKSGKEIKSFDCGSKVFTVSISSDSKTVVSGCDDGSVLIWDIESEKLVKKINEHKSRVTSVAIGAEGKLLSSCGTDRNVIVWDIEKSQVLYRLTGHQRAVKRVAFSPDGLFLASSSEDKTIIIWDIKKGESKYLLHGHTGNIEDIAFSPPTINDKNGGKYLASVDDEKTLMLWEPKKGIKVASTQAHDEWIWCVEFTRDGKYVVTGAMDNKFKVWNINGLRLNKEINIEGEHHYRFPMDIDVSPDGSILGSVHKDKLIRLWKLPDMNLNRTVSVKSRSPGRLSLSMDDNILATLYYKTPKIWDLKQLYSSLIGTDLKADYSRINSDGSKIAVVKSKELKIWTIPDNKLIYTWPQSKHYLHDVQFSDNDKYIISTDKNTYFHDVTNGEITKTFHNDAYSNFFLNENENELISVSQSAIITYNTENASQISKVSGVNCRVCARAVSKDGKYAASTYHESTGDAKDEKVVKIIDIKSGDVHQTIKAHDDQIFGLAFSPDIKILATSGDDNIINLWNTETGDKNKTLIGHTSNVRRLLFSNDGRFVISGSNDNTIKIWNVETGKEIVSLISTKDDDWLAITPDGYWDGSKSAGELVSMVKGMQGFGIDQFAIHNNRPDIILSRLGSTDKGLISHFFYLYKKRLRKLGLAEKNGDSIKIHVPEAKILSNSQEGKFVKLDIELSDSKFDLNRYNIYMNDIPVFGAYGKRISGRKKVVYENLELGYGINKIEVSCLNIRGTESFRDVLYYNYNQKVNHNLYFIGFGVSTYKNPSLNLQYAHKDALDLEKVAKSLKGKGFENVYTKVLTNEQVTPQSIKAAKAFVKNAKPDDTFILFIAGHGMHDRDAEATYYFLTHNTDLKNLKGTAATFETIEDLLQGIPPRNKLFLMDACESGEIDPEDEVQYLASATQAGVNSRGFKKTGTVNAIRQSAEKQSVQNRTYLLNRNRYIYNDLVRRSGAIVFSSSKGGELSYERSDIENGLFTEYILKALTTKEADENKDGIVSTDELRKYVSAKVAEASKGLQHPTVDRDNIYQKFGFIIQ